jgi:hypothetical protein
MSVQLPSVGLDEALESTLVPGLRGGEEVGHNSAAAMLVRCIARR